MSSSGCSDNPAPTISSFQTKTSPGEFAGRKERHGPGPGPSLIHAYWALHMKYWVCLRCYEVACVHKHTHINILKSATKFDGGKWTFLEGRSYISIHCLKARHSDSLSTGAVGVVGSSENRNSQDIKTMWEITQQIPSVYSSCHYLWYWCSDNHPHVTEEGTEEPHITLPRVAKIELRHLLLVFVLLTVKSGICHAKSVMVALCL